MSSNAPDTESAPQVGVVLCAFKGERHLAVQLDSILAQTCQVDEIVLVDDASTDASPAMLAAFARRTRRGIAVLLQRNRRNIGFVQNSAGALQQATADIIPLCDQDDCWHSTRVEECSGHFAAAAAR